MGDEAACRQAWERFVEAWTNRETVRAIRRKDSLRSTRRGASKIMRIETLGRETIT
jgi:hypothetical protein